MAAAALMVAPGLVLLVVDAPVRELDLVLLGVELLLTFFLLRGSRIVWVLGLLGSIIELPSSLIEGRHWMFPVAAAILVCLLAPASRRFVWTEAAERPKTALTSALHRPFDRAIALFCLGIARLAQWENDPPGDDSGNAPRPYGTLILRLGIALFFLYPTFAVVDAFQEGADSLALDILAVITRIGFRLALLGFFAAVALAAYSRLKRRKGKPSSEVQGAS